MGYIKANYELATMYKQIIEEKKKFGKYHKTIFHLHTPASHDFRLLNHPEYTNYYKECSDDEIYSYAKNELPMLERFSFNFEKNDDIKIFNSKKEFLAYLLIAKKLADNNIEIVLVTDHNNINGYQKLLQAIKILNNTIKQNTYTELIMGIEISCADKNHVVGIFNDKNINVNKKINQWLKEYIMNEEEGTYLTSLEVIKQIDEWKGIPYIAHFDNSDFFKDSKFLNIAYKKKLFSLENLCVIGLATKEHLVKISNRIKDYSDKDFCYVIDEDSHSLEEIGKNIFWLKGNNRNYNMIASALRDYNICIEHNVPHVPQKYIKGLVIRNNGKGFLKGKNNKDFCISFSEYLNCFIGGRGTGKSTIINIIEYTIQQSVKNEKMLDLICKHSSIWLLFEINNREYMIQLYNPQKEYEDDNILKYFSPYSPKYNYKYKFYNEQIKQFLLERCITVYEIKERKGILYSKPVNNKRKYLDDVFSTAYSINELVETSNGNEINDYIYNTLFKNKTLSSVKNTIRIKSINGLKKKLQEVSSIKDLRKKEVEEVVTKFNDSQKGILRIIYRQEENNLNILNIRELISRKYPIKDNYYYKKKNISTLSIVDYLEGLNDKLGLEKMLLLFINNSYEELEGTMSIKKILEEKSQKLIDKQIEFIKDDEILKVVESIAKDIINNDNIPTIVDSLRKYIKEIESFDLEFNINNKEQKEQKIIYKSVRDLSLGQKVVAMLSFVLGFSDFSGDYSPLVIDQPEDNLDNQYIYKNLVQKLKEIKSKRQIIIATHNATIVTNAKAEQVIIMESDNINGWIKTTGYPNEKNIKTHIINYLEGGIESFKHKYFIYKEVIDSEK
ncbi:MAG: chromosome segregation protein SMC [Bacilli bacterium]|nr:chromosome segregation protein SMC [Bacilli bacterium]